MRLRWRPAGVQVLNSPPNAAPRPGGAGRRVLGAHPPAGAARPPWEIAGGLRLPAAPREEPGSGERVRPGAGWRLVGADVPDAVHASTRGCSIARAKARPVPDNEPNTISPISELELDLHLQQQRAPALPV